MNEYKLLKNIEKYATNTGKLCVGLFDIYINKKKNIIYKKNRSKNLLTKISDEITFLKYKDIIENSYKKNSMKKYIIEGFDVEIDGSYKCKFIDGIRLDKIDVNLDTKQNTKFISLLKQFLNDLNNSTDLSGDWGLHNVIYDINNNRLYNIDLEGFFSFQKLPGWGSLNNINKWINEIIKKLDNETNT